MRGMPEPSQLGARQRRDGGVRLRAVDEGEALFRFERDGDLNSYQTKIIKFYLESAIQ